MQKALVLMVLTVCSALALAQGPSNKNKAVAGKAALKTAKSASEEATAAAQAAAIAQAAGPSATSSSLPPQTSQPAPEPKAAPPVVYPALATPAAESAALAQPVKPAAPASPALASGSAMAPRDAVSAEELAIAKRVHQGHLACEMGTSVRLEHDAAQPGYFNLHGKGFRYRMRPVVTSTGAIRLEDAKAGAVWLQLANKSMLMDQKKGRRVADDCAHPEQLAYAENMKTNPPPKLFDTSGMGR